MAHSHGWQVCAGCWQQATVPCHMDPSKDSLSFSQCCWPCTQHVNQQSKAEKAFDVQKSLTLLRENSSIQSIQLNMICMFTKLCNHHDSQFQKIFIILKKKTLIFMMSHSSNPPETSQPQETTNLLLSLYIKLPVMHILHKLNHTVYGLFRLASFT